MAAELAATLFNTRATGTILGALFDDIVYDTLNNCLKKLPPEFRADFNRYAKMRCNGYRLNFIKTNLGKRLSQLDMTYVRKCCKMLEEYIN